MENVPQIDNLTTKKLTLTPSKTIDVILGFLGSIGIGVCPLLLNSDPIGYIIAGGFIILALVLSWAKGFKYFFYGILSFVSIVGIVFGGCVFILLNLDL